MVKIINKTTPVEFPGIGIEYDTSQFFFEALVMENLRLLRALSSGRKLLGLINGATPLYRGDFPTGVNVMLQPPISRQFAAPGLSHRDGSVRDQQKYDAFRAGQGLMIPSSGAKTQTSPCKTALATGGGGTVCWLYFSNTEIRSSTGEELIPYITLGHELIHALRALKGEGKKVGDKAEEYETVGIKGYSYAITENDLRKDAGMPLRTTYFAGD